MSNDTVSVTTETDTEPTEVTVVETRVTLPSKMQVLKYSAAALAGAGLTALAFALKDDDEPDKTADIYIIEPAPGETETITD